VKIGIDFDNTIAGYDHLFSEIAIRQSWVERPAAKNAIRDTIRRLDGGELKWQRLQAEVYGPCMDRAEMIAGVGDFLSRCKERGISVFVVSHKTRYAKRDSSKTDLREAAKRWMDGHGFFDTRGFAIPETNVYFESTREEKVARIAALDCTHFVDDLAEVFRDAAFPANVKKYLFTNARPGDASADLPAYTTWDEISRDILGAS